MILRSRTIPTQPPKEPNTPRKRAESINVLTPQPMRRGLRRVQLKSPAVQPAALRDDAVTPSSTKHTLRQAQNVQDSLEDEDGCSPPNLTETDCPYFSDFPEEEAVEDFNPSKFICSAQAVSCDLRQRKYDIPFKTRSAPESTLVLELEKVLVESSLIPQPDAEFTFLAPFQDTYYKVYVKLRPHAREFLETVCKIYEIFVFTTAKKEYAEKILKFLDPQKKLIRHRLYQKDCVCVSGQYVKDLNVLHRDLAKTVALDTVAYTLPFHLTNRIPVRSWLGNQTDKELLTMLPVLEQMTHMDDVRQVISHQFHVDELVAS